MDDFKTEMLAITRSDGGLSVMQVIVEAPIAAFDPASAILSGFILDEAGERWLGGLTDEGAAAELVRAGFGGCAWRRIEPADLPADRHFRDAWRDDGKVIAVDIVAARDIHRDRLRALRSPILLRLDEAYLRADENGDQPEKSRIVALKRRLRNMTADPAIEAAGSPEQLAQALPSVLAEAASISASSSKAA